MIKVLIVDDEIMFRIGVKSCINWSEYGVELVGEAADGSQALKMIREFKPDIVFTDIKMPVMDGLELTKCIASDYPDIKVIIMSCYNDFEYVKEAMKYGARDYILKLSMKPSDIIETIVKIKASIKEERSRRLKDVTLKQEFNVNIDKIKESFLKKLIFGNIAITESEFMQKAASLSLRLKYENNIVVVFSVDNYKKAIGKINDDNLFKFVFINISNEIINKHASGEVIEDDGGGFIGLVNVTGCSENKIEGLIIKILKEINFSTRKYVNFSVSAGISKNAENICKTEEMYNEASLALLARFYSSGEYIGVFSPNEKLSYRPLCIDVSIEDGLQSALEVSDPDKLNQFIKDILERIAAERDVHPDVVKNKLKEILFIFNRSSRRFGGDITEVMENNPLEVIEGFDTLKEITEWIFDFSGEMIKYITRLKNSMYRNEIIKVIDHIKSNLDKNISLKEAAVIANMNEKYLCNVFKKETGKNFVDYISEMKVDTAKELLKIPDIKSYEVALKLGFDNESYFSKLFKKYTGMAPQEYKKSIR